jgi:hypothetical protein
MKKQPHVTGTVCQTLVKGTLCLSAAWAPKLHLKHSSILKKKNFSDVLWDMKCLQKKKPAAASSVCKSTPDTNLAKGHWVKLQKKTIAKKPARSYILGSIVKGEKPKLVVEVSEKVFSIHPCY